MLPEELDCEEDGAVPLPEEEHDALPDPPRPPAGEVLLREPEDADPILRDSHLLARGNVPENTIATLEAGIQRLQGLRFLPRGPPAKRREIIDKAHRGMGRPPSH